MKEKFFTYIKSVFSEANGTGSATRVLAGAGVVSTIVWVSFIVFSQKHLPDLGGAAMYVSASFSGYAVNKVTTMASGEKDVDKSK